MPRPPDLEERLRTSVESLLDQLPAEHAKDVRVAYEVMCDLSAAAGVLRAVEEHDIDVLMMGMHGRRGFRRFILGSVAVRVLHEAACDVVVVPEVRNGDLKGRILVPVDLFGRSREVLEAAGRLAVLLGVGIDLLYVIDTSLLLMPSLEQQMPARIDTIDKVARGRLRELVNDVRPEVDVALHVSDGHPAREILDFAEEHENGLMVLASSGMTPEERELLEPPASPHRSEQRWMLGSITERVVTHARIPVWVRKKFANGGQDRADDTTELEMNAS